MKNTQLWFCEHSGEWMVLRRGVVLYQSYFYLDAYSAWMRLA